MNKIQERLKKLADRNTTMQEFNINDQDALETVIDSLEYDLAMATDLVDLLSTNAKLINALTGTEDGDKLVRLSDELDNLIASTFRTISNKDLSTFF